MKKNQIALIVGRFQPFHNGHLYLLKKALLIAEKVILGIGSASIYDKNNPLSYEQRKIMIETVVKNERISDRVVKIIPLEDFNNDKKWLKNLCKQVGGFNIAMGNNEWTNKILKKAGYKIIKVDHYKRYLYEGWRIRKLIRSTLSSRAPACRRGRKSRDLNWKNRVPNYIVPLIHDFIAKNNNGTTCLPAGKVKQFDHVVLGGTFDHFHAGHKALLKKAFELGKKVTIGIATEEVYKDKFLSETIEPFEIRKKSVEKYIKNYLMNDRIIDIIPFSDFTGGADKIKKYDAIIVSKRTYPNALKINQLREKNKLPLLKIITINNVLAEDGKLISSERIRAGEIDRKGNNFQFSPDLIGIQKKHLIMPESLREELRKPLGKVFKSTDQLLHYINIMEWTMMIAVGDAIIDSLLKSKIDPDVKVIDFKVRRKEFSIFNLQFPLKSKLLNFKKYKNKPGTINFKTAGKLKSLIHQPFSHPKGGQLQSWLIVDGEEDLLALPSILFAPLNSLVLYGHWQLGIIAVEVTEKAKNEALRIVKKFS